MFFKLKDMHNASGDTAYWIHLKIPPVMDLFLTSENF